MKSNATELARIGEDERAFTLTQHQVGVLGWPIIGALDPDLAGHSEMNEKEVVAGEFEEHPFPSRVRTEKSRAN